MNANLDQINTLEDLDAELARSNMRGQWLDDKNLERAILGPRPSCTPFIWRWDMIRSRLQAACKVLTDGGTARRSLGLVNPSLPRPGSTHTVYAAMQLVRPGELAWAHRHSISALRFGIEGDDGLYTVVNGEKLAMKPNDLILTPSYSWHDHHNDSKRDGLWLDVLDLPLILGIGQTDYATYGERAQPLQPHAGDGSDVGTLIAQPSWAGAPQRHRSMRYPWSAVERQLERFADSDGSANEGVMLEYVDPVTGGSALPTLGCNVQMLRSGLATRRHRKTSSSICYVIQGSGTTVFDDQEMTWSERDVFAIPEWTYHRHVNASKLHRAVLFVVNDVPLLRKLELYREE
jgi:1-hydroxy-2-naphthoate dioxygenase